ncbi:MAG: ThiF family adenylyltransferase [Pirellulaceae bacterium]|nr:ThiF family adenylyltransferase [Pirellulaceae bacterium]
MPDDALLIDDSDRYSRLRLIGWWDQDKIRAARVLVVGAGAIGNEVLKNLALLGIGHVWVIDLDAIEDSNLTRSVLFREADRGKSKAVAAADEMRRINPDVRVTPIHGNVITDLGLGLFRDVNVVIGALDNREARLWVNRQCWKVGTPWIDGGIQEISGVAKVFLPPDGACYECAMTENDYRLINLRYSCPLLKREDLLAGKVPTAPTIASMIGGLQVQEALKLIHGLPVEGGKALVWNGQANNFYKTAYQRRADCLSHETYPEPIAIHLSAGEATADDLFDLAAPHFGGDRQLTLKLDRDLVVSLACPCGDSRVIMRPQQLVGADDAHCPACGQTAKPRLEHSIDAGTDLAGEDLADLGIPPYDIVRVGNSSGEQFFLLAADRRTVLGAG